MATTPLSPEDRRTAVDRAWNLREVEEVLFLVETGAFHATSDRYY